MYGTDLELYNSVHFLLTEKENMKQTQINWKERHRETWKKSKRQHCVARASSFKKQWRKKTKKSKIHLHYFRFRKKIVRMRK